MFSRRGEENFLLLALSLHFIFNLPPGLSYLEMKEQIDGGYVRIEQTDNF